MLSLLPTKPWLLFGMARQFAELHSAIHDQTVPSLPPLRPYLQASIVKAEGLPAQITEQLLNLLAGRPDGEALCHFDFHPDQVVLARAGPMILDWMTAFRGDPLADVARTTVLIRFGQAPHANWMMRSLINAVRSAFYARYLRRYLQLRPTASMSDLSAPTARVS